MSNFRTEIKWGFLFTTMMILWMLGERLAGLHGENIARHATWSNAVLAGAPR
jgi:hypothetical protein